MSSTIGALPTEASGAPRFYVDAVYSKDAGALVLKQTSVWRWEGDHAQFLWIDSYDFSLDVDSGVHYRSGNLSILEKRSQRTFGSCNSCFEPTTLHRLRITPGSIEDLGETSRAPELDLIDELFWRIAHNQSSSSIATPQAAAVLRQPILEAKASWEKIDPESFYVGMLTDWSVIPTPKGSKVCFTADDFGRFTFTFRKEPHSQSLITAVTQATNDNKPCPVRGAIRHN